MVKLTCACCHLFCFGQLEPINKISHITISIWHDCACNSAGSQVFNYCTVKYEKVHKSSYPKLRNLNFPGSSLTMFLSSVWCGKPL